MIFPPFRLRRIRTAWTVRAPRAPRRVSRRLSRGSPEISSAQLPAEVTSVRHFQSHDDFALAFSHCTAGARVRIASRRERARARFEVGRRKFRAAGEEGTVARAGTVASRGWGFGSCRARVQSVRSYHVVILDGRTTRPVRPRRGPAVRRGRPRPPRGPPPRPRQARVRAQG